MSVSLDDQIKCVRRELALRKNVYPSFVAKGRMKQAEADLELERMQAVHNTLTKLQAGPPVTCQHLKTHREDEKRGHPTLSSHSYVEICDDCGRIAKVVVLS